MPVDADEARKRAPIQVVFDQTGWLLARAKRPCRSPGRTPTASPPARRGGPVQPVPEPRGQRREPPQPQPAVLGQHSHERREAEQPEGRESPRAHGHRRPPLEHRPARVRLDQHVPEPLGTAQVDVRRARRRPRAGRPGSTPPARPAGPRRRRRGRQARPSRTAPAAIPPRKKYQTISPCQPGSATDVFIPGSCAGTPLPSRRRDPLLPSPKETKTPKAMISDAAIAFSDAGQTDRLGTLAFTSDGEPVGLGRVHQQVERVQAPQDLGVGPVKIRLARTLAVKLPDPSAARCEFGDRPELDRVRRAGLAQAGTSPSWSRS